jgi:hypothetical protein
MRVLFVLRAAHCLAGSVNELRPVRQQLQLLLPALALMPKLLCRQKKMTKQGHGITLDRFHEEGFNLVPTSPIFLVLTDSARGSHSCGPPPAPTAPTTPAHSADAIARGSYEVLTFNEGVRKMGFRVYVLNLRGHGNCPLKREKTVRSSIE